MVEQFLKHYPIVIQEKLHQEESPLGQIILYQTTPFGKMLLLNDHIILTESDSFILHEMMVHPAIFSHPHAKNIAVVGHIYGVLQEIIKHTQLDTIVCIQPNTYLEILIERYFMSSLPQSKDKRVREYASWEVLSKKEPNLEFDVIIFTEKPGNLSAVLPLLAKDGILVHPALPSLIHLQTLKALYAKLKKLGFKDCQSLNFPQPSATHGWRTIIMANKRLGFKRIKESDIFNRSFSTRFYNYDIHRAALVLPEFMREALLK